MVKSTLGIETIGKLAEILPFRVAAFYLGAKPYMSCTMWTMSSGSEIIAEYSGKELWLATMAKGTEGKTTLWQNVGKEFYLLKIKSTALNSSRLNGGYGAEVTIDRQGPAALDRLSPQRQLINNCSGVSSIILPPDSTLTIESVVVYGRETAEVTSPSGDIQSAERSLPSDEVLQWNTVEGWVLVTRHSDRFGVELTIYAGKKIWEAELKTLNERLTEEPYHVRYIIQRKAITRS